MDSSHSTEHTYYREHTYEAVYTSYGVFGVGLFDNAYDTPSRSGGCKEAFLKFHNISQGQPLT